MIYIRSKHYNSKIKDAIHSIHEHEYAKAHDFINDANTLDENAPDCHNLLGILFEVQGNLLQAAKHYRAALALEPSFRPAINNLTRVTSINYHFDYQKIDYGSLQ